MPTVLIIDDDVVTRTTLRDILQNLGYTTFEAADGRTGITVYREQMPDVVIVEMLMPEKDGFETVFDLRRISLTPKIIMMTGGGRITIDLYRQMARSLGIPDMLVKPFSAEAVSQAIASAVSADPHKAAPLSRKSV